jgi:DNA-binding GntR family transcriptional regulator
VLSKPVDAGAPGLVHISLPDSVHQTLRRRILNNELGAGMRLVEANLAEDLGVSRGTVRVALRQLATEGLVDIAPRRHSVVTRMSYADIEDACYARYVLEEGAMRAIPSDRLTALAEQLCRITESMEQAARTGDLAAIVDLDTSYHGCIVHVSDKRRLAGLWSTLDGQMGAVMRSSMEDQHIGLPETVERHRELAEVIRSADRAAIAEALYGHYLRTPAQ